MVGFKCSTDDRLLDLHDVTLDECREECFKRPTCLGLAFSQQSPDHTACGLMDSLTKCYRHRTFDYIQTVEAHTCHSPADQILNNTKITGATKYVNNHQLGNLPTRLNNTEDKLKWCRNWVWASYGLTYPQSAWTFAMPMNDSHQSVCSISESTQELNTTVDVNDEDYVYYSGPIFCPTIPSCWSRHLEQTKFEAESQFYELISNVALTEDCWNICRERNTGSESCVGWSYWHGEDCYLFQDMAEVTRVKDGNFTSGLSFNLNYILYYNGIVYLGRVKFPKANQDIIFTDIADAEQCKTKCMAEEICKGFTWHKVNYNII